jgi:hypothetical protein
MTAEQRGSGFNSVIYLIDSHFEASEFPTKSNLMFFFDLTLEKATYIPLYLKSQEVRLHLEIASITFSRVWPWLRFTVIAKSRSIGKCC